MENLTMADNFVYGSELQGRGYATHTDKIVGGTMFGMALVAVLLGIFNIVIIKKVEIFHNAFGALWVLRTLGEIGSNLAHVVYSGPATYL
ncbi:hypothetical protein L596_013994 [Steinernema carpocapsae]|uniref:7TM GPCR serpentine receptor class x (Srx) domain-containing protein n=1 Tax=Steinernema carpocapsae TaxID=34508 RepID=A0A4U5NBR4_STECR|nr:hypothetical protein L596_013994 [Steinernema carpocapsae]